jgi:hypothetical protein
VKIIDRTSERGEDQRQYQAYHAEGHHAQRRDLEDLLELGVRRLPGDMQNPDAPSQELNSFQKTTIIL